MIERNFVEIQGAFLVKIRGTPSEWFKKDCIGSITTWDDLVEKFIKKFYQPSNDNEEIETEEDDDPNDISNIFNIEGNLFDYETPLCEAFNDFNYILKIDMDLFTLDIQGIKTYKEYELNNPVTSDAEEPCGELPRMVRVESMTYFQDHKCFGDFHELDYNVLVTLQECWWKINVNEVAPFTHSESYCQRPYANFKTEKTYGPYLDINQIFDRNYDTSNVGNAHDNQGHEERRDDPTLKPPVCKIRRFEMMKYSFNIDE
ncbi:hypothetical protein Tco_0394149 [Tanacetum coccineum]